MSPSIEFSLNASVGPAETRIEVIGELDAYSAPQLRKLVDELLDKPGVQMVIDLSRTSFVDSTGLGVIVGAARKVGAHGGELSLDSPTPGVYRVLQMTGVSVTVPIDNAPPSSETGPRGIS